LLDIDLKIACVKITDASKLNLVDKPILVSAYYILKNTVVLMVGEVYL